MKPLEVSLEVYSFKPERCTVGVMFDFLETFAAGLCLECFVYLFMFVSVEVNKELSLKP